MPAALGLDDAVLDLVAHAEAVAAADRVGLDHQRRPGRVELAAVDRDRPALLERARVTSSAGDLDRRVPVGDAHDRRRRSPSRSTAPRATSPRASPPRCWRRSSTPSRSSRGTASRAATRNSLISARPPSSSTNCVVEPRLVDPQGRVDQQPVAVEALDVVALVGAAVAPDVDAVVVHRPHQQRAGDGAPERRGVEVRPAGGA